MPRKKSKYRCARCVHWQPGDSWMTNAAGVYADGTCKPTGKAVANVHHACRCFILNERMGVIIHGQGAEQFKAVLSAILPNKNTEE